jgi:hypothetical protein
LFLFHVGIKYIKSVSFNIFNKMYSEKCFQLPVQNWDGIRKYQFQFKMYENRYQNKLNKNIANFCFTILSNIKIEKCIGVQLWGVVHFL